MHQSFNRFTSCINILASYPFGLTSTIRPTTSRTNVQQQTWELKITEPRDLVFAAATVGMDRTGTSVLREGICVLSRATSLDNRLITWTPFGNL